MAAIRANQADFLQLLNSEDSPPVGGSTISGGGLGTGGIIEGASIASNTPQSGAPNADGRVIINITEADRAAIQRVTFFLNNLR